MHLDLVKKKLENAIYSDLEVFARDVRLVFDNAILYNGDASEVGQLAQSILTKFNDSYANLVLGELKTSIVCSALKPLFLLLIEFDFAFPSKLQKLNLPS